MTKDTYGPNYSALSPSQSLTSSLANRLRVRLDVNGSPEYRLTWKHWDLPSGLRIWALRASGRPTGDSGFTGWPSPNTPSGGPNTKSTATHTGGMDLEGAVTLMGWPSPNVPNGGRTLSIEQTISMKNRSGGKVQVGLEHVANLAPWITPQSHDYTVRGNVNADHHHAPHDLSNQVALTPGPTSPSSPVSTEKRGALNPAFSRWLMGFPPEWDGCAGTATQLSRRSRQLS